MDRIVLKNMAFYGYHGNLEAENQLGQRFFVDITLSLDLTKAGQTDNIADTISYAEVYELVADIMQGPPCKLLERLATLIGETIWNTCHDVVGLSVTVRKPSAPVAGLLDYAEVTINRGQI